MHHLSGTKLRLLAIATAAAMLAAATVAWATPVEFSVLSPSVELNSEGNTVFDARQPATFNQPCGSGYGTLPSSEDNTGFTPANDAHSDDGDDDVFDGGLVLSVGDEIFEDEDRVGDLVGEQLTVGPTKLHGLKVKRVETALQDSPTLRSLLQLKNSRKHKSLGRTLTWESDFGADGTEIVAATSDGDQSLANADRWVVADDDDTDDDGDPTFVLFGRGKGVRKAKVANPIADQDGCVRWTIRVKVPAKSSRFLLLFTEIHDDGDRAAELADAAKFNTKKPGGGVLEGLKKSVKKKVLNWDLAKRKP